MRKPWLLSLFFALSTVISSAQCGPTTTLYAGNNGQDGIMFDITAVQNVVLTNFDCDSYGNTHTYEIYYKVGTHVGFTNNAAAWTLLGTAPNLPGNPRNTPTAIPITFSLPMCPGDTYGFYITSTSTSGSISYTNGTAVGNVYVNDGNIQIKEGTGKDYPFNTNFTTRIPNITVHYVCSTGCCVPPTMTSAATSCSTACDGTATATVTGGVGPFSYQWDAAAGNQTAQTATGLCAGTYTVSVTDGNGCVAQGTVTVAAGPAPPVVTVTPAGPFCTGDAALNLSASQTGGTWSGMGITNATSGTFDPATAGVGSHVITYTIPGTCGATDTVTIVVNANADATISAAGPFCTGDPATNLSVVTAGGTWSGTGITNATNGTFDPATAGSGSHIISYTIAGACGATDTETIVVNPNLNSTITPAGPFCTGSPAVNLSAATAGGTWSGTGITDAVNGTFDPSVSGNGSFVITYSIPGACGSTDTETIVVNNSLSSAITPGGPYCQSDAVVNLTAASPGGTWSGTGITNATSGTFDPPVAGAGTHTITYTISGACGSTSTEDFIVLPNADATITAAGPFCTVDAAVNLTAAQTGGTWSGTGITDAVNGTFDPAVAGSGAHVITYTIAGQCGATDTETITVNQQMDATISAAGPFCESDASLNLSAVDAGGVWSGNGITNAAAGTFDPVVAGPGTHTITYTINGACGATDTEDITVLPDADATITLAGPFCIGNPSVTLSAVDAGGTWSGNGITDAVNGTFDPATAGVGTTSVTYTIGGQCGDIHSIVILITANDDATITPVNTMCEDAPVISLTAATSGGTWSGNGITNAAAGTFDPAFAGAGTHTITYTISGVCGATATTDIVVNPLPVVTFSADQTSGCEPLLVNFSNTTTGSVDCFWDFGNGQTSVNCGAVSSTYTPGTYSVTLTTVDANGCSASQTISNMINSYAYPDADFVASPQPATTFDPTIEFGNASFGGNDFLWDFSGLGTSTDSDPSFTFPGAGTYPVTLYVLNSFGCMDSITHDVVINNELIVYLPNAFSPNGDGKNDVFLPVVNGTSPNPDGYEFFMFNRWGEQVFYSDQPGEGWDGMHRNMRSPEGVYVYRLNVIAEGESAIQSFLGHVTLVK